jgi:hypothetical protein
MAGRISTAHRGGRTYQLMEVGPRPCEPAIAGLDGRAFVPGFYVSTVDELPASRGRDGRVLVRGYYAVFWPMDDLHEHEEASAMYFGPFASERDADGFVRRLSSSGAVSQGI